MVSAGMERVFEIGHAYRAEKHETPRHINEYVSLDIEMGFIESEIPLIEIERRFIAQLFETLCQENAAELTQWESKVPDPDACNRIPIISHEEAKNIVKKETGQRVLEINPEAERILCQWAEKEHGIAMVFINEFPRRKRPFYTYPQGQKTMSFDLLFRGLEITTGGRRYKRVSHAGGIHTEVRHDGNRTWSLHGHIQVRMSTPRRFRHRSGTCNTEGPGLS